MKRQFRLWVRTQRIKWNEYWEQLTAYYIRKTCSHYWRAVVIKDITGPSPGKVCRICDSYRKMALADFYAEFGEVGMAAIHTVK
jgi:hypothetical protein